MTGRIFEIKRFAVHDGNGVRTTVFFKGCPLRCKWCHNPEGLSAGCELAYFEHKCVRCGACVRACPRGAHELTEEGHVFRREKCVPCGSCVDRCPNDALLRWGRDVTVDELLPELLADRPFYELSGGGVTLSGGECLLQAEFCFELLSKLKKEGISTAVDTCGAVPWKTFQTVLPVTDCFLYDVKAIDCGLHRRLTGAGNEEILENLRRLCDYPAEIEVRVPFVPDENAEEMPAIAAFLAALPRRPRVRVLAYHDLARSKYRSLSLSDAEMPARVPTPAELKEVEALFRF